MSCQQSSKSRLTLPEPGRERETHNFQKTFSRTWRTGGRGLDSWWFVQTPLAPQPYKRTISNKVRTKQSETQRQLRLQTLPAARLECSGMVNLFVVD